MNYQEHSHLELGLIDREAMIAWPFAGPLTHEQAAAYALYERFMDEQLANDLKDDRA